MLKKIFQEGEGYEKPNNNVVIQVELIRKSNEFDINFYAYYLRASMMMVLVIVNNLLSGQ